MNIFLDELLQQYNIPHIFTFHDKEMSKKQDVIMMTYLYCIVNIICPVAEGEISQMGESRK